MTNEFFEAIQPGPPPPTRTVDHPHFYRHVHEQEKLKQQARNMTRQQLFDNGFITVEDLDDEELRAGRCRDAHGRIPKVNKTMEMVPRDLYDEMVAEHAKRFDEKLRQQLDTALNTFVEVMTDPTCEPKDRMEAARFFVERVRGKSVERVAVSVSKAPWEELLGDVAHVTRAQHEAMKAGAIDVEFTALPEAGVPEGVSEVHEASEAEVEVGRNFANTAGRAEEWPSDPSITPAEPAPSFDALATSNPVGEPTLSEAIRAAQAEQVRIAEARNQRRKLVQDAKKRRMAARASGTDVLRRNVPQEAMAKMQERLTDTRSWPPNTSDESGEA